MTTIANEVRAAALNGITALFNSGFLRLQATGPSTLASLTFGSTAFAAASTANPSVAVTNAITPASSPTAGTISLFRMETSASALRFNGTVGTTGTDFITADPVIPADTASVTCSGGLSISLSLS